MGHWFHAGLSTSWTRPATRDTMIDAAIGGEVSALPD